jgi:hypothetical protein
MMEEVDDKTSSALSCRFQPLKVGHALIRDKPGPPPQDAKLELHEDVTLSQFFYVLRSLRLPHEVPHVQSSVIPHSVARLPFARGARFYQLADDGQGERPVQHSRFEDT